MTQAINFQRDERGIRMAIVGGTDDRLRQELALEAIKESDALTRVLQQSIGKSGFERVVDTIIARINELHSVSMSVLDNDLARETQDMLDIVFREEWLIDEADAENHDEALPWHQLCRERASAELVTCRSDSLDDVKAGMRFGRSMLNAMKVREGGEETGPGDDECKPFAYDAMGLEIQTYLAAALLDSKSEDFIYGFSMGLAAYLHPGLSSSTIVCDNILTYDPVEVAVYAGICSPDPKPEKRAAVSRKRQAVAA